MSDAYFSSHFFNYLQEAMKTKNPKVDDFLNKSKQWKEEMTLVRSIALETPLKEELKWYQPCYTYNNANVAIISAFKDYCIIGFFKGALLKDEKKLLTQPGKNTQSGRQMRFTDISEIKKLKPVIKSYLLEAIEVEKSGLKVELKKTEEYDVPEELLNVFSKDKPYKKAFESLTPGRQRAYLLHFSAPKQSATKLARIEKYRPLIMEGKGILDDYNMKRKK